jgi:hypothetical protein
MFVIFSPPDLDRQALDADPDQKAYVFYLFRIPPFGQVVDIGIWTSNFFFFEAPLYIQVFTCATSSLIPRSTRCRWWCPTPVPASFPTSRYARIPTSRRRSGSGCAEWGRPAATTSGVRGRRPAASQISRHGGSRYIGNSVSDPDSIRSVDPDPYSESGSGSSRAKMTHKSRKNLEILCFNVLDVLF